MEPLQKKQIPLEAKIEKDFLGTMMLRGWYFIKTHGNKYQSGFPDLYGIHSHYGTRWVELKRENGRFTDAQMYVFPKFAQKKIGVWVITGEHAYDSLHGPANWGTFLLNARSGRAQKPIKRIPKSGPEGKIQDEIIAKLTREDWFCLETYGSTFQTGLPDIYCCHQDYGARWIEVKNPDNYRFQPSQIKLFPIMGAYGVPIYILMSADQTDLIKNTPANWRDFLYKG